MIDYNLDHINIPEIKDKVDLGEAKIKHTYRVYGLKMFDKPEVPNPCVLLECPTPFKLDVKFLEKLKILENFFKNNNISFNYQFIEEKTFFIGLRRDFRNDMEISACIVSCLVYFIENKLKINGDEQFDKLFNFEVSLDFKAKK